MPKKRFFVFLFLVSMLFLFPRISFGETVKEWLQEEVKSYAGNPLDSFALANKFAKAKYQQPPDSRTLQELFSLVQKKDKKIAAFALLCLRYAHSLKEIFQPEIERVLLKCANNSDSTLHWLALNELLTCRFSDKKGLKFNLAKDSTVDFMIKHLILLKNGFSHSNLVLMEIVKESRSLPLCDESQDFEAGKCVSELLKCEEIVGIGQALFDEKDYALSKKVLQTIMENPLGISLHEQDKAKAILKKFRP